MIKKKLLTLTNMYKILVLFQVINYAVGDYYYCGDLDSNINYFQNLIDYYKNSLKSYTTPVNNNQYKPTNNEIKDYGTYDFIIVGAGSAGSVIASRLSEVSRYKVLLLEAGEDENDFSQIPAAMGALFNSPMDWGYLTVPQRNSCFEFPGQRCHYPRGKSLGGSSAINAMAYARGNRGDYDNWASKVNDARWSYNAVLPLFKRSERTSMNVDYQYHGKYGPLHVEHNQIHDMVPKIIRAAVETGHPYNCDYNGAKQLGTSLFQATTNNGVRMSTNQAFLQPILHLRPNLTVLTRAYVTKVLLSTATPPRATGVQFTLGGTTYKAYAQREVILSAGAVNTPPLLMLSGIGDRAELTQLGIRPVVDLPAVGKNLVDHPALFSLGFSTNRTEGRLSMEEYIQSYVMGFGNFATVVTHVINFYKTANLTSTTAPHVPDYEIMLNPSNNNALMEYLTMDNPPREDDPPQPLRLDVIVMLTHPESRGTVKLASADPYAFPLVDPNNLNTARDVEVFLDAIETVMRLSRTEALRKLGVQLILPATGLEECETLIGGDRTRPTSNYWRCYLRYKTGTLFHPEGTCIMGPDTTGRTAVVNSRLQVYGVNGLRIADASVIPVTISGHTNPACIMIGERAADLIKEAYRWI